MGAADVVVGVLLAPSRLNKPGVVPALVVTICEVPDCGVEDV